jgi:hypothetical protein
MSATATLGKRLLVNALRDAEAFRDLFEGTYHEWIIAGSIRRGVDMVGDVDHVVYPRIEEQPDDTAALFPTTRQVNLVWQRAEQLVGNSGKDLPPSIVARLIQWEADIPTKHMYGATGYRWGDRYRGFDFRGFKHEIWTADAGNLGSILVIRTGPEHFSQHMVSRLLDRGMRHDQGRVWQCRPCPFGGDVASVHPRGCPSYCSLCKGTGLERLTIIPTPTEETFFRLVEMEFRKPEDRR